jgi:hypothetical protein
MPVLMELMTACKPSRENAPRRKTNPLVSFGMYGWFRWRMVVLSSDLMIGGSLGFGVQVKIEKNADLLWF